MACTVINEKQIVELRNVSCHMGSQVNMPRLNPSQTRTRFCVLHVEHNLSNTGGIPIHCLIPSFQRLRVFFNVRAFPSNYVMFCIVRSN